MLREQIADLKNALDDKSAPVSGHVALLSRETNKLVWC